MEKFFFITIMKKMRNKIYLFCKMFYYHIDKLSICTHGPHKIFFIDKYFNIIEIIDRINNPQYEWGVEMLILESRIKYKINKRKNDR